MEHKFKYTLRNLLKVLRDDKLIVSFSGGLNSVALLKMMSETLFNPVAKKMFFTVQVIHIDESIIYDEEEKKSNEELKKIKEFCSLMKYLINLYIYYYFFFRFELQILKIQDVLSLKNGDGFLPELSLNVEIPQNKNLDDQFRAFVNNLSSIS